MKTTEMTTTRGKDQFYPTPPSIAEKMLAGLDMMYVRSVLEPSAGKGDLIDAIGRKNLAMYQYDRAIEVDFCEIDPYLRQICKYNFSDEKKHEIYEQYEPLQRRSFSALSESEKREHRRLDRELDLFRKTKVYCVHDDFLSYRTYKHYDLILMNPPFANGDEHLLRAIKMQERQGGSVICLLNAETVRNPYTGIRIQLAEKLKEYDAKIEYVENAFSDAERKADVDVAIIRVHIPQPPPDESDIWKRMKKAVEEDDIPDPELHALITGDYIEQAITLYRTEVAATMELVRQYKALIPYMGRSLKGNESFDKMPILNLVVGDDNYLHGFDLDKYMRTVRLKYWSALFSNEKFIGRLTSELRDKYHEQINRMADYEFSAFNIKQVALEMQSEMTQGIEKAIMDLFEKLTYTHAYDPDFSSNKHYYNGWVTNKAWKIGKKCIIPTYGMFSWYKSSRETFYVSEAYKVISDIEKAFDYLDGGRTGEINLLSRLEGASAQGKTRNIECKYFKIDIFKKGTTHIKFYPEAMPLVDRLNIYASQKKGWLPPRYGKARYKDMAADEKAVVDSFHGDGATGSGEKAYTEVMTNAAFYLAEPTQKLPALMAATE